MLIPLSFIIQAEQSAGLRMPEREIRRTTDTQPIKHVSLFVQLFPVFRLIGCKSDYRFYEFDYPRNLTHSSRTKSK
jgi:hypothetical protein